MASAQTRRRRIQNEVDLLRQLCRANPSRLGRIRVNEAGDAGASRLSVTLSVTTAIRSGEGPPSVGEIGVEAQLGLPRNYPQVPPALLLASEAPLFLGGVDQIEVGDRWVGPACLYRHYDPHRHTLVQHVISAYAILAGRTVASERDSLKPEAARYWLEHEADLPFDDGLVVRPNWAAAEAPRADFELIAVGDG